MIQYFVKKQFLSVCLNVFKQILVFDLLYEYRIVRCRNITWVELVVQRKLLDKVWSNLDNPAWSEEIFYGYFQHY